MHLKAGDPNTIEMQLGGGLMKEGVGGNLLASYSYRGIFDMGAELTFTNYNKGDNNNLKEFKLMPFGKLPVVRQGEGLPFSIAAILGVNKHMSLGNGPVPGPDGWGVLAGASSYINLELSDNLKLIPEVLVAFDFNATHYYSLAQDQNSSPTVPIGTTNYYDARALVKVNVSYRSDSQTYLIIPYAGYQGAFVAGGNLGVLF
jgi:hypothetical protein